MPRGVARFVGSVLIAGASMLAAAAATAVADPSPAPRIERAVDLARLSPSDAARGIEVRLVGQVLFFEREAQVLFVADSSGVCFVDPLKLGEVPAVGRGVEVHGMTSLAAGFPSLVPTLIRETALAPALPPPEPQPLEKAGSLVRVELTGIVRRSERVAGFGVVMLHVGRSFVEVRAADGRRVPPPALVDAEVAVAGVLDRRSPMGRWPRLWIRSFEELSLVRPATPAAALAVTTIEDARRRLYLAAAHRVRLRGELVRREAEGSLTLRDGSGEVEVHRAFDLTGASVGATLDVAGFLEERVGGLRLVDVEDVQLVVPEALGGPGGASAPARAGPVVPDLVTLRGLSVEQAGERRPVDVVVTVTHYDLLNHLLFVERDGVVGVALYDPRRDPFVDRHFGSAVPLPGQRIRLRGRTAPGARVPIVTDGSVEVLARAPLPEAPVVSTRQFTTGKEDCRRVALRAMVRRIELRGEQIIIDLESEGQRVRALLAGGRDTTPFDRLVGAQIRAAGVCATRYDWRQRMNRAELLVSSADSLILERAPEEWPPLRPIQQILRPEPGRVETERIRVRGTVLFESRAFGVFVKDETGSLLVEARTTPPLFPGDEVEALGFPEPGERAPRLADAALRIVGRGSAPVPANLSVREILGGLHSYELVRFEATLLNQVRTRSGPLLLLQAEGRVVEGVVSGQGLDAGLEIPPGSLVELTGVALVDETSGRESMLRVFLHSLEDVVVQKRPPWWTPGRAQAVVLLLLAAVLLAASWGSTLRARVKQQTAEIRIHLEEVRESEDRYRTIFELETDAIFVVEAASCVIADANQAASALYGFDRAELIGRPFSDLSSSAGPPSPLVGGEVLRSALSRHRKRDGSLFPVETASRLLTLGGRQMLLVAVRDITERQTALAAREALIADLESKNAELERFTYTVSHDLKSPLVTINGFLALLEQDIAAGSAERTKSDLERIAGATKRMRALLDDLLELSRVGRKMNPPCETPFAEIVEVAHEQVTGRLRDRGVEVVVEPDLPAVYGDKARLVDLVQNLLDNAAQFMGDQVAPRVEVGQRGPDGEARCVFFVRDNGVGIEAQHQERVFGLFEKLDTSTSGTGIGLALARRIVEVHGGRIWVESEGMGRGATFCFSLPVAPSGSRAAEA